MPDQLGTDDNVPINWQTLTMKQTEQKNRVVHQKLNGIGYNGDVFKIEAYTESHTSALLVDLSTATEDGIVLALSEFHGILGSIYHSIRTTSVSTDEYFFVPCSKR
jgi:hypothetical protein